MKPRPITKLSYSRLQTFLSCPKKYFYNYVEGIEAKPGEPLILGQLFHELLEAWYSGEKDKVKEINKEYQGYVTRGEINQPVDLFEKVLNEYVIHYRKQDKEENILGFHKGAADNHQGPIAI